MDQPPHSGSITPHQRLKRIGVQARRAAPFAAGLLAGLLALLIYHILVPGPQPLSLAAVNEAVGQAMASATAPPARSALVYQVIQPSLVLIQTDGINADGEAVSGLGTGVVVDDRGSILTALHVVANAAQIKITFADGSEAAGGVLAVSVESDIAVIGADHLPGTLVPAVLGNPNAMSVGDEAYVVGHPLGLHGSLSAGVISGLNRTFRPHDSSQLLQSLIQIDAAVNPGNSGGPLLNRAGQVVGIVVGLVNPTEQDAFAGIGFAVPIDVAGGAAGMPQY